jgi:hypothetical protein
MSMPWARSVGSACGGTSRRMRSGRVDSSAARQRAAWGIPALTGRRRRSDMCETLPLTLPREVKQQRHLLAVRQPRAFRSQLVEELVDERLGCSQSGGRRVLEQVADERDGVGGCAGPEDLGEWVRLDLGELVLHVLHHAVSLDNTHIQHQVACRHSHSGSSS